MSKLKEVLDYIIKNGYTIDADGVVRNPKGDTLKGSITRGYIKFSVRYGGNSSFPVRVHRFQGYLKFSDKIFEKGIVLRHLDGNSLNNKYDNIEIGTQSDNMFDRPEEDRKNHTINRTPMTQAEEDKIKELLESGRKTGEIFRHKDIKMKLSTLKDRIKKIKLKYNLP